MSSQKINRIRKNAAFEKVASQRFSLPRPIICYASKNPSFASGYQKLIQSCKHFYLQNPITVFDEVTFFEEKVPRNPVIFVASMRFTKTHIWIYFVNRKVKFLLFSEISNISFKLWFTNEVIIGDVTDFATDFLNDKRFHFDAIKFWCGNVILGNLLRPNNGIKKVAFYGVGTVLPQNADGSPMSAEAIFKSFPNVQDFSL